MPSAGEVLRSERIKRGRTLPDLAKETCITSRYLTAIEDDDAKTLPGHFFHRNFVRQYAAALGLEDSEISRILALIAPAPEIDPLPALSLPAQIAEVEHQSKPLARISARVAAALLFIVVIGCSGLYALWNRAQESADRATEASQVSTVSEPTATAVVDAPKAPDIVENARIEQPPSHETGQINVNLAATEKTWVSVSSAGRTVFAGVLNASQTKDFALNDDGKLLTSNAAGLDVRMNGRPIGPLGHRGQVKVVLFRQDQYEILSPRKM